MYTRSPGASKASTDHPLNIASTGTKKVGGGGETLTGTKGHNKNLKVYKNPVSLRIHWHG